MFANDRVEIVETSDLRDNGDETTRGGDEALHSRKRIRSENSKILCHTHTHFHRQRQL